MSPCYSCHQTQTGGQVGVMTNTETDKLNMERHFFSALLLNFKFQIMFETSQTMPPHSNESNRGSSLHSREMHQSKRHRSNGWSNSKHQSKKRAQSIAPVLRNLPPTSLLHLPPTVLLPNACVQIRYSQITSSQISFIRSRPSKSSSHLTNSVMR